MPDLPREYVIFGVLVTGAIVKMVFAALARKNRRQKMVKVGTVTAMKCYPVKSCRGIPVTESIATRLGLKCGEATDRHWMAARSNGDFVTQRQFPKMALISVEVLEEGLVLNAPDMPTLTVPLCPATDRAKVVKCRVWSERFEGMDCGDDAAFWFSTYLKTQGLRMLFSAPSLARQDLTRTRKPAGNPSLPGDQAAFSDWGAYLVVTEESLAAVNEELEEKVTIDSFRPNIVIAGSPAFDEDNWNELQIGEVMLRMLDRCARCVLTTVSPEKGEKDPKGEPLETLRRIRCVPEFGKSPVFGVNAAVDVEGVIRVGDPVYALLK
ncbi:mitochondrial amidoxime-reducing component 1-like [Babylonia areolata]|uniref:mitochondrial amidoxime-reducing component 1-like n=1 Tax=Babylonia areolata TaxID=304850 RepID=UPI003FD43614